MPSQHENDNQRNKQIEKALSRRLILLILSTLLGSLTVIGFFTLTYDSTGLAFWIISSLTTLASLWKYHKIQKLLQDYKREMENEEKNKIENIYNLNHQKISQYTHEINEILINQYHFKKAYRPLKNNSLISDKNYDTNFFIQERTPSEAAKLIYEQVVKMGDNYNPEIFQESYTRKASQKFSGWNKIMYGAIHPDKTTKRSVRLLAAFLILFVYGLPQIFSPYTNTFIPSQNWLVISDITTIIIVIIGTIKLLPVVRKINKETTPEEELKMRIENPIYSNNFESLLAIPLLVAFLTYFPMTFGVPKALNQIIGNSTTINVTVIKDPDTTRPVYRGHIRAAYCVNILIPPTRYPEDSYCISKAEYDLLPLGTQITLQFQGTTSYFGTRLEDHVPTPPINLKNLTIKMDSNRKP